MTTALVDGLLLHMLTDPAGLRGATAVRMLDDHLQRYLRDVTNADERTYDAGSEGRPTNSDHPSAPECERQARAWCSGPCDERSAREGCHAIDLAAVAFAPPRAPASGRDPKARAPVGRTIARGDPLRCCRRQLGRTHGRSTATAGPPDAATALIGRRIHRLPVDPAPWVRALGRLRHRLVGYRSRDPQHCCLHGGYRNGRLRAAPSGQIRRLTTTRGSGMVRRRRYVADTSGLPRDDPPTTMRRRRLEQGRRP